MGNQVIFWLYFYDIQYFPDLDFDKSVLLLVAAITSGYILVLTALVFMSPYIIRGIMLKTFPASDKEMASDKELNWYFCSIFLVYFAFFLYFYLEYEFKTSCLSCGIPILIVLVIFLEHMRVYFSSFDWIERKPQCIKKKVERELKDKNMFLPWLFSVLFMFLILAAFIVSIVNKIELKEFERFILYGTLLVVIITGNFLFAIFQESTKKTLWHWTIPFLMVFFVFFFAGKPVTGQIPKVVMNKFKFGNFEAQRLLLDHEGCEILKNLELIPSLAKDQKTCFLEDIKILSRLGNSFYFETTCKPPWLCVPLRFTIPSKYVLSWSVPIPDKKS
jgi:hypothetical protein